MKEKSFYTDELIEEYKAMEPDYAFFNETLNEIKRAENLIVGRREVISRREDKFYETWGDNVATRNLVRSAHVLHGIGTVVNGQEQELISMIEWHYKLANELFETWGEKDQRVKQMGLDFGLPKQSALLPVERKKRIKQRNPISL